MPTRRRCEADEGALVERREAAEQPLHRVDLCQVAADVVVTALLAGSQLESPLREGVATAGAAEVNDRGQVLLLLERRHYRAMPRHRAGDAPVEQRRRHLDGVARHDPRVEPVEPARAPLVPRAFLDYLVIVNAVAPRLAEGRGRDLVHSDRPRCRLIPLGPVTPPAT